MKNGSSKGQNLVLAVFFVPNSLGGGRRSSSSTSSSNFNLMKTILTFPVEGHDFLEWAECGNTW